MRLHQVDNLGSYVRYLQENPQETQLLFNELLIGVTKFFRDPAAWERLAKKVIPALLFDRPTGGALRAWVPGCSTGEEAYSLAIVFREALAQVKPAGAFSLQIFATDLDKDAIDKARASIRPTSQGTSRPSAFRGFRERRQSYRVAKEIRETVIFAQQNVIMDPPFTKLDILACRNLLIYLSPELQKRVLPLFHYSLNPGGILFLGSAETAGVGTDFFAPLDNRQESTGASFLPCGRSTYPSLSSRPRSVRRRHPVNPRSRNPSKACRCLPIGFCCNASPHPPC
jgi:two-component system CheB/CheR fusion protein